MASYSCVIFYLLENSHSSYCHCTICTDACFYLLLTYLLHVIINIQCCWEELRNSESYRMRREQPGNTPSYHLTFPRETMQGSVAHL